jgi:hypothetical protein
MRDSSAKELRVDMEDLISLEERILGISMKDSLNRISIGEKVNTYGRIRMNTRDSLQMACSVELVYLCMLMEINILDSF